MAGDPCIPRPLPPLVTFCCGDAANPATAVGDSPHIPEDQPGPPPNVADILGWPVWEQWGSQFKFLIADRQIRSGLAEAAWRGPWTGFGGRVGLVDGQAC